MNLLPSELTVRDHELLAIYHENLIEAGLVLAVVSLERFQIGAVNGFDPEQDDNFDD